MRRCRELLIAHSFHGDQALGQSIPPSPRRMIVPLPSCRSICPSANSNAFSFSVTISFLIAILKL